jgi:thioredoxin-dependent peroxiredoxin
MQNPLGRSLFATALVVAEILVASPARAQAQAGATMSAAPAAAPAVGATAPDFKAVATDSTGQEIPVSLAALRGKVVVLAFYPLDRSQGCTAELSKFRDEYATLFGDGVVVLPASVDSLASHAGWAKESHFPFAMIADPSGDLAREYASAASNRKYFNRTVYVIGRDGKISYEDLRFGALSQDAYDKLAAAIKTAKSTM